MKYSFQRKGFSDVTFISQHRQWQKLYKIEEKRNYNEESVNRMVIAQIMEELPEKERTLIRMRYFEERTQTDIAAKLGISQVQVSRMEKKILASMKKKLA